MTEEKQKGRDMRLRITDCKQIYQGHNKRGDNFTIFEIKATKPNGQPIDEKLRAFTSLPIGQEIDVNVQVYNSEQWGKSFTVYPKGSRSESATGQLNELRDQVVELQDRNVALTRRVADLETRVGELLRDSGRPLSVGAPPARTTSHTPEQTAELNERFGEDAPW